MENFPRWKVMKIGFPIVKNSFISFSADFPEFMFKFIVSCQHHFKIWQFSNVWKYSNQPTENIKRQRLFHFTSCECFCISKKSSTFFLEWICRDIVLAALVCFLMIQENKMPGWKMWDVLLLLFAHLFIPCLIKKEKNVSYVYGKKIKMCPGANKMDNKQRKAEQRTLLRHWTQN